MWRSSRRGLALKRMDLRRSDGQAMAEFALVVPLFLLIFVGMVALGRAFFLWNDANHVANETARWAAIDHNPYGVPLQENASDTLGGAKVCISFENGTPTVGNWVKVQVEKPLTLGIHLPGVGLNTGFTIHGTSTMRIENLGDLTGPTAYDPADNSSGC
jgi:Flp pilus assembly protein TadG